MQVAGHGLYAPLLCLMVLGCTWLAECHEDEDCLGTLCRPVVCRDRQCEAAYAADGTRCDSGGCRELLCADGSCTVPGSTYCKEDDNPCTKADCDILGICAQKPIGGTCKDDNPCTDFTKCIDGKCSSTGKKCDDGLACTADTCTSSGCVHTVACPALSEPCAEYGCTADAGCQLQVKSCDDGDPCTKDACSPPAGCAHVPLPAGTTTTIVLSINRIWTSTTATRRHRVGAQEQIVDMSAALHRTTTLFG